MKILVSLFLCVVISPSLFADASIDTLDKKKTILLTAPGTLSGGSVEPKSLPNSVSIPSREYRYAGDRYDQQLKKMPQFGQQFGQNNPWTQQQFRPSLRPDNQRNHNNNAQGYNNPWHIGGPQPVGPDYNQQSFRPPNQNQFGNQFGGMTGMYPEYAEGIYRDTNPAANSPLFNGMMPGGMGNDFPFSNFSAPFTPFGMF